MRSLVVVLALLAATFAFADDPPPGTIQVTHVTWVDGPPTMPKGTKMAILEGDPKVAGAIFTMRLRVPAGSRLMPHWHPLPERVVVLSGQLQVGFGDTFVRKGMKTFDAGGFYVNPPESHHYVYFPKTSIVQITGLGPWVVHPLP